MQFTKAERKRSFLRLGLTGPSGSGKTYGALLIAKGIGGKIAVVDTEHGSASLYSHLSEFDVLNLAPPYRPERFIECIEAAEKAGYTTLIIDSLTHEWTGKGGILELVDEVAKAHTRGNTWAAWSLLTPRHRAMIDTILRAKMHVICTLRSKTESTQVDDGGRKKVVKLGLKSEQRDGFEYELTTVLDIVHDGHFAVASKDRSGLFAGGDPEKITPETGSRLLAWLNSGGEMLPQVEIPQDAPAEPAPQPIAGPVTGEQLKQIGAAIKAVVAAGGDDMATIAESIKTKFGVGSSRELTTAQADEVLRWLSHG